MKLFVTAKPRAKEESVRKINDAHFEVTIKEPPIQGRANVAVIRALANFLSIAPSRLRITSGHASRRKIIEMC